MSVNRQKYDAEFKKNAVKLRPNHATKIYGGARSASEKVETEIMHLYDLNYKGCINCYGCQRNNDATYGQCQVKDDLYDLLRKVPLSDGAVFGCAIYLHDLTAELRAFIERLVYQYLNFGKNRASHNAPKKLHTFMIYTMNVTEESAKRGNYDHILSTTENYLASIFRATPARIGAYNTYQYKDYSQYRAGYWYEHKKRNTIERSFR